MLWFVGTGTSEAPEVRHAMLLTLREPVYLTLIGFFWSQAVAWSLWLLAGHRGALWWLAADVVLFLLRIQFSRRIALAEERQLRLPAAPMFFLHAVWLGVLAFGSFLAASQPDVRLMLLGVVLPIGFCGYVVSRWQAFPRYATIFIYLLWGGLFAGLLVSPLPGFSSMAWLMPSGGVAFHVLLRLNHRIIATALRAQQENRRLSMQDPLTELPNRMMLRERLTLLCRRLAMEPRSAGFAVLCLDLDGFKAVNDRYGHAAGDWLLKSVGQRLLASVRSPDLVCRVGGDEFVVLLPGANETVAVEIAERLLHAVNAPHELGDLVSVPAHLSIGIAIAPARGAAPDSLLAAADAGLYEAKRAGKGVWRLHASAGQ